MANTLKCPVCNSNVCYSLKNEVNPNDFSDDIFNNQLEGYLNTQKNNTKINFNIAICPSCQLLFKETFFSDNELEEIYRHEYYSQEAKMINMEGFVYSNDFFLRNCSKHAYDLVTKINYTQSSQIKRIFDIGGRNGFRLIELARKNFECMVFDPIPIKPDSPAIRKEYVFLDEIDETKYSSDLILLCNILEHCKDPVAVIQKCNRLLNPEGFLFIQVPFDNPQILEWIVFGKIRRKNLRIDITHFLFFSKNSLKYLLTQNGFECLTLDLEFLPIIENGNKILVINLLAQKSGDKIPPPKFIVPDFDMINLKVLKYQINRIKSFLIKKWTHIHVGRKDMK